MADVEVVDEVASYLGESAGAFARGTDEYFARLALDAALRAYLDGNYGIGAVAVVREGSTVREYLAGNMMVTGQGVIDHAETRAILRIAAGEPPDQEYDVDVLGGHGLFVFGTLEPCPMCACVLTNSGASRSVSTVPDGKLVVREGFYCSDGAANVFGEKFRTQPEVWQTIQSSREMSFELLSSANSALRTLSQRIFEETREQIDQHLADRTHKGHAGRVRQSYAERFTQ